MATMFTFEDLVAKLQQYVQHNDEVIQCMKDHSVEVYCRYQRLVLLSANDCSNNNDVDSGDSDCYT